MIWGFSSLPSLASAETAVSSCSGVTATAWPMPIVATSDGCMVFGLSSKPSSSPGSSTPVGLPKPKASEYFSIRSPPIRWATSANPVLIEYLMMSENGILP